MEESPEIYVEKPLYLLDLRPSVEQLVERMSSNRRRHVKAFSQADVEDGDAVATFLAAQYPKFMREKGAAPVYGFDSAAIEQLCTADGTLVVGARGKGGSIASASVFGYSANAAEFLFNAATEEGRSYSTAVIWHAVLRLKALGVQWLNLGGGVHAADSLSEYKRRFGAHVMMLHSLRQVYDEIRFDRLCCESGASSSNRDGWFPPYRSPR